MGKLIFEAFINSDPVMYERYSGEPASLKFKLMRYTPIASIIRYDYIHYLKFFEVERASEEPYYVDYAQRSNELEAEAFPKDRRSYTHFLSTILIPSLAKVREVVFKSDAQNVVNETALLLAKYHQDQGFYPKSLDALVPQYIEMLPVDLFNGATLIYRKEVDGFALYSVGPNLEDDGGATLEHGFGDAETGDVIWAGAGSTLTRTEDD
jgi:uncharacterized protein (DUF2132 family)